MSEIRVKSITYAVKTSDSTTYEVPPLEGEEEEFRFRLDGHFLTFEMKDLLEEDAANALVDSYVRAWETSIALQYGPDEMRFIHHGMSTIDLDKPEVIRLTVTRSTSWNVASSGQLHVTRYAYPTPPIGFVVSPDVEVMYLRYRGFLEGREPLASMAYFCLPVVESSVGGRKQATEYYNVSSAVLRTIARLSSEVGNERDLRKMGSSTGTRGTLRPYTPVEVAWLREATKLLIRRVGERASMSTPSPHQITLSDLPPL